MIIETHNGKLLGEIISDIACFKGIPFALAPIGERRWRPPEAAPSWSGVRGATHFGSACPQPLLPQDHFYYAPDQFTDEDCLYLNIWTDAETSEPKPVMVWLHGGSLISGSGAEYDGAALAEKGVVLVTINYRLNIFGYFSHPELNEETPYGASGNYGILDQIAALKWIRKNITAFGGDPDNITIFGESAGALSVLHLLTSPLANGLFNQAILQSPYMPPSLSMSAARFGKYSALTTGLKLQEKSGCKSLCELRALPPDTILAAAEKISFYPQAVIDGYVLTQDTYDVLANGAHVNVPILAGFNSGEVFPFAKYGLIPPIPPNGEAYISEVQARYGSLANQYLALYPASEVRQSVFAASRDAFYGWATESIVRSNMKIGLESFLYVFDHITAEASALGLGAFHASELPFVFNNIGRHKVCMPNWPPFSSCDKNKAMANLISDYWVTFARTGKPKASHLPKWNPFLNDDHAFMVFRDGNAECQKDLLPGMYELHEQIVSQRRTNGKIGWWPQEVGLFAPL